MAENKEGLTKERKGGVQKKEEIIDRNVRKIVVTGSSGFIGRNLMEWLDRRGNESLRAFDLDWEPQNYDEALSEVDVVYHLAGVNRPPSPEDYEAGNAGTVRDLVARLERLDRKPLVVLSSSTQAELDNPYGRSKRHAEEALAEWAGRADAPVAIFRLPNVLGKWCRPNYNSAVATFCHNIARNLPITISNRGNELLLVYVDDVIQSFISLLDMDLLPGVHWEDVTPIFRKNLGQIVDQLYAFRSSRTDLWVPNFSDPFVKRLYATYLSYLPEEEFAYDLERREDPRGVLAELFKMPSSGQIFVSRTKPGNTRGNHYHDTKTEKFCVLEGEAIIRFRHIQGEEVITCRVSGREFKVVDIPPGYTHSIENIGTTDMVVLFWASEPFDPDRPDTYACNVIQLET